MIGRLLLILTAVILLILSKRLGRALERVFIRADEWKMKRSEEEFEEEDDLTAKGKWRIIIAGYLILILFAVFASISIYTLNQKINTLYGSVRSLEETVAELEQGE